MSWYELEAAESYIRTDEVPLALKKLASVRRHFTDFDEDHFGNTHTNTHTNYHTNYHQLSPTITIANYCQLLFPRSTFATPMSVRYKYQHSYLH